MYKTDLEDLHGILDSKGILVDRDTVYRFLKVLEYVGSERGTFPSLYKEVSPAPDDGLVISIPKLPVVSFCRHHILPWVGWVSVEYKPSKWILGLSKFQRAVDYYSHGLTLQEEFTKEFHTCLRKALEVPVKVEVRAMHTCAVARGVKASPDFQFVTKIEE